MVECLAECAAVDGNSKSLFHTAAQRRDLIEFPLSADSDSKPR